MDLDPDRSSTHGGQEAPQNRLSGAAETTWQLADPADRAALAPAVRLLGAVWPAMLDELRASVAQVVLSDDTTAEGDHTDAVPQGTVLIDRHCLTPSPDGLLGSVRLAEALVREGTRTRYDAAAECEPFVTGAAPAGPLRRMVVLSRCALLYRRLLESGPAAEPALEQRHARLLADLGEAVAAVGTHRAELTDRGLRLLDRGARLTSGAAL
ncbi:hypothetical protein [Streptomyces sp. UNOC14_S4]|uniref:hypothetical protein n=1 Tax=Streptomyces sp. UNOC14_S4 TaxID=2872340 RepID=UPI001E3F078A|nr:hypothetical protein [Streptomyces sp. UNOC14_S4]MCC3767320.1 hypothetical protein [Streptomyces sp. UNOC14_S4]